MFEGKYIHQLIKKRQAVVLFVLSWPIYFFEIRQAHIVHIYVYLYIEKF